MIVLDDQGGSQMTVYEDVVGTLRAQTHQHLPIVLEKSKSQKFLVYNISSYCSNCMKSSNPYSGIQKIETSRTLDLNGGNPACNQGGMMVLQRK